MVLELDNLKVNKRSNSGGRSKNNKIGSNLTVKLDSYIKNIESERDFYKKEVDTLNEIFKSSKTLSSHKSRRDVELKFKRSSSNSPHTDNNRCTVCHSSERNSKSPSPSRQKGILKPTSQVIFDENELIKISKERDELKCLLDKFERHMAEVI